MFILKNGLDLGRREDRGMGGEEGDNDSETTE